MAVRDTPCRHQAYTENEIMHYCNIKNCDIANGVGVRVSLFVSGCRNHCKNCFQPETWAFDYGEEFTEETEEKLLKMLAP